MIFKIRIIVFSVGMGVQFLYELEMKHWDFLMILLTGEVVIFSGDRGVIGDCEKNSGWPYNSLWRW